MKKLLTICAVVAFVLALSGLALADTIYVDDDNCPGPGTGTLTDPYCSIQAAIDAASPFDTVNVAAGTYAEYLHITTDDLTIEGAGIDQSIIDLDGLIPYWHYSPNRSFASRAGVLITGWGSPDQIIEGVTFKGFTVKNAGLNPPITETGTHTGGDDAVVLTDTTASWTPGALVGQWVHNVSDKLIVIDISGNNPIRSYGLITDNTATTVTATLAGGLDNDWDNGDTYVIMPYEEYVDVAEDLQDDVRGIGIGNGKDISILYCKVINSGYGGITAGYARRVSTHKYSEGIIIDHCISSDHPAAGIGVGNHVGQFTITNNICCNNGSPHPTDPSREYRGYGIQVSGTKKYGTASGLIANNKCKDNGFEGIVVAKYTDGVTVEDNIVTGHNSDEDGAGIFMYHWGNPEGCKNHIVRNNKVKGNHRGIIAYYASASVIVDNNIETDSGVWYAGPGIKLDHSYDIEVKNNSIHGVEGHGLLMVYSDDNNIHDNALNNNGKTGIYLSGSHNNVVLSNNANRNEHGIKLIGSDNNHIEANRFNKNDVYDLYEEASTGNVWINNKYKTKNW